MSYGTFFASPRAGAMRRTGLAGVAAVAAALLVAVAVVGQQQRQEPTALLGLGAAERVVDARVVEEERMLQHDLAVKRALQMQARTGAQPAAARLANEQRTFLSRSYADPSLAHMQQKWVGSPEKFLPANGDYPGGSTGIPEDGYLAYETGWGSNGPFHGELAPIQEAGIASGSPAEAGGTKPPRRSRRSRGRGRRTSKPKRTPSGGQEKRPPGGSKRPPAGGSDKRLPGGKSRPSGGSKPSSGGNAKPKVNMNTLGKELGIWLGGLLGGKIGAAIGNKMKKKKQGQKIGAKLGKKLGKKLGHELGKELSKKMGGNGGAASYEAMALNLCGLIGGKIGLAIGSAIGAKFVFFKKLGKKLGKKYGTKLGKELGKVLKKTIAAKIAAKFGKKFREDRADQMQLVEFEQMLAESLSRVVDQVAEEEELGLDESDNGADGSAEAGETDSGDMDAQGDDNDDGDEADDYSDEAAQEEATFIMKKLLEQDYEDGADDDYADYGYGGQKEFDATPGDAWGMKQEVPQQLRQRQIARMFAKPEFVPVEFVN